MKKKGIYLKKEHLWKSILSKNKIWTNTIWLETPMKYMGGSRQWLVIKLLRVTIEEICQLYR